MSTFSYCGKERDEVWLMISFYSVGHTETTEDTVKLQENLKFITGDSVF